MDYDFQVMHFPVMGDFDAFVPGQTQREQVLSSAGHRVPVTGTKSGSSQRI